MKFSILLSLLFPIFSHAACISGPQQQMNQASQQLAAQQITQSQFDLAKVTYINAKYACHLISSATFCSTIDAAFAQTLLQIEKDYPPSDQRQSTECQIMQTRATNRMNCDVASGNGDANADAGLAALSILNCP